MDMINELFNFVSDNFVYALMAILLSGLLLSLLMKLSTDRLIKIAIVSLFLMGSFILATWFFGLKMVMAVAYTLFTLLTALVLDALIPDFKKRKKKKNLLDVPFHTDKGVQYLNLARGLGIFGAAGSGKTASGFAPILKHAGINNIPSIIYDYKDFELTEMAKSFYMNSSLPFWTVAPQKPEISHRVNPIHPNYLKSSQDAAALSSALIENLLPKSNDFFSQAAKGALTGVIWTLRNRYLGTDEENKCSLPYACALLLIKELPDLISFIESDTEASLQAKAFTASATSDRQIAGVMGTLANALTQLLQPGIFWVFSGNDFSLNVNEEGKLGGMSMVSHPKYEKVLAPFLAVLLRTSLMQISERDRHPSLLLWDEFPTLYFKDASRIPATMRSYEIATVIGVQDKVQMVETYSEVTMRALLANLSSKMLGKANGPDTAKFYEQYFEIIEKEQRSITKRDGFMNEMSASVTTSTREKYKHRAQEFLSLKAGEFFFIDDQGNSKKARVKMPTIKGIVQEQPRATAEQINEHYHTILDEVKGL